MKTIKITVLGMLAMAILLLAACSGTQQSMDIHLDKAWSNTSKGIRECQRADQKLAGGDVDSATKHYNKALNHFDKAVDQFAKAADDADVMAGKLLDEGNEELQKAVDKYYDGDMDGAATHYEKALDKYDQALALVD